MKLKVLIDEIRLKKRIEELAKEISREFEGEIVTVISVLKGAFIFTADLVRLLKCETVIDFVRVKSYSGSEKGKVELIYQPELDLKGRKVLVVDDIFDTGESLGLVLNSVKSKGASVVKSCVLLDKEVPKLTDIRPDFVGFKIPDHFVVGYGLDLNEIYRDLPYIGYFE